MVTLKNPAKHIPFGFNFYQPEIKHRARGSIDQITRSLVDARLANPGPTSRYGWSTDYAKVREEVISYNAQICQRMGWTDYILEADGGQPFPIPFSRPHPTRHSTTVLQKLGSAVAGAETLVIWLANKREAVPAVQAEHRAGTCSGCPMNDKGDILSWFTKPVSEAIRKALRDKDGMELSTSFDDILGVCSACSCPLKLKVWLPKDKIMKEMPKEAFDALHEKCWLRDECNAS